MEDFYDTTETSMIGCDKALLIVFRLKGSAVWGLGTLYFTVLLSHRLFYFMFKSALIDISTDDRLDIVTIYDISGTDNLLLILLFILNI